MSSLNYLRITWWHWNSICISSWEIPYQSQICCKVASLRDHHGHFIRRIKLILRGHVTAGTAVTWQQFVIYGGGAHIPGCGWWPAGGSWFLWTHGSCFATYCPLGLSLWHRPFWWDVHGLPQLFVETSVLGGLSSLSPGYGQFHQHTAQGIPDTGFHRRHHTVCDQVSCLWGGPGWSTGCWRACGKPRLHGFWKFWPAFRMYLWYKVGPCWCGPGPLWCYERCRTCFGVGGS